MHDADADFYENNNTQFAPPRIATHKTQLFLVLVLLL